jgi:hypothetical protein
MSLPVKYEYSIVPKHTCVFIERGGDFSAGHSIQTISNIMTYPDYKPGFNFLTDARNMDYTEINFTALSH